MLALVGTVMSRSPSGNVLLRDGDGVLGTHRFQMCSGYVIRKITADLVSRYFSATSPVTTRRERWRPEGALG
jgi:hypothetical protein